MNNRLYDVQVFPRTDISKEAMIADLCACVPGMTTAIAKHCLDAAGIKPMTVYVGPSYLAGLAAGRLEARGFQTEHGIL